MPKFTRSLSTQSFVKIRWREIWFPWKRHIFTDLFRPFCVAGIAFFAITQKPIDRSSQNFGCRSKLTASNFTQTFVKICWREMWFPWKRHIFTHFLLCDVVAMVTPQRPTCIFWKSTPCHVLPTRLTVPNFSSNHACVFEIQRVQDAALRGLWRIIATWCTLMIFSCDDSLWAWYIIENSSFQRYNKIITPKHLENYSFHKLAWLLSICRAFSNYQAILN